MKYTLVNIDFDTIARTNKLEFGIRWLTSQLIIFKLPTLRTLATIFL